MSSPTLLQRLSKFLQTSQPAFIADCRVGLPTTDAEQTGPADAYSWRGSLARMIDEISRQLAARAAGEGWNIEGAVSDEEGGEDGAIQSFLLEATTVRNLFLRTLNRFQASQTGQGGFTAAEMTEVRQEAMDIFDRVTTAAVAQWIRHLQKPAESRANPLPETPAAPEPPKPPEPEISEEKTATEGIVEELRQCVRAVSTQLGKLRAVTPTGRDESAAAAMRHLQRMSSLLESLGGPVSVTPVVAAPSSIRVAPLAVRAFLEALSDAFRPMAEQKGLRFVMQSDASLMTVDTDAPKLQRAASLLLGNAVHYTVKGGITLAARASGDDWLLSIEDTGPGIEPLKLANLLGGVSMGPDRVPHGLAVARELVQLLGGHVDADSILRRGSRFTICLPRTRN